MAAMYLSTWVLTTATGSGLLTGRPWRSSSIDWPTIRPTGGCPTRPQWRQWCAAPASVSSAGLHTRSGCARPTDPTHIRTSSITPADESGPEHDLYATVALLVEKL